MTDLIRAPWTAEQVTVLNEFQQHGGMHPFTCGHEHPAHPNAILEATTNGWRCHVVDCEYTQDWAHAFMADPEAWPKWLPDVPDQLDHLERELARLRDQLAILVGARPTPEQLAGEDTADKDMARRIHQARPGIPVHHVLATLEAFRAVLDMEPGIGPGYCPHCGRGDAAPTADEYEQQRQRAQQLAATLDDVLRHFVHKGHPGEPCLSSGWISEKTVAHWRDVAYPPQPAAHDTGPTVREAAAADRAYWEQRDAGQP